MSRIYTYRLQQVLREYESARSALEYMQRNWYRRSLFLEISDNGLEDFRRAANNLETIFVIRLFSIFEGTLKEHLAQHHSSLSIPEDARAIWLIDRTSQRQTPPISSALRQQVHEVRQYRNFQVHATGGPPTNRSLEELLSRLTKFVDKLPEPR